MVTATSVSLIDLMQDFLPSEFFAGAHCNVPLLDIQKLDFDSRSVCAHSLFFAYKGTSKDGREFIAQAIEKGAAAIIKEADLSAISWQNKIPIIEMPNVAHLIGRVAKKFYRLQAGMAEKYNMQFIGVTGTNGKSSIVYLTAAANEKLGVRSEIIGTLGYGKIDKLHELPVTTPDPIFLQKIIFDMQSSGVEVIAMEASSHGLTQGRLDGVDFDIGVFTNLTRDHLDYHKNMQAYAEAKELLFNFPSMKHAIFNIDDPIGKQLFLKFANKLDCYGYTMREDCHLDRAIRASNINLSASGFSAIVSAPFGKLDIKSRLLGRFNVSNMLAVISILLVQGYDIERISAAIAKLHPVVGRMQALGGGKDQPLVIIDFAHTPDGLEKVLEAARMLCKGRLFVVFGCGGDRDRGKRPIMAEIAERFGDRVIVTSDNVRFEDIKQIIGDIMQGFQDRNKITVIENRREAIQFAIFEAKEGDVVVLAGKGHEAYEIVKDVRTPFREVEIVRQILESKYAV